MYVWCMHNVFFFFIDSSIPFTQLFSAWISFSWELKDMRTTGPENKRAWEQKDVRTTWQEGIKDTITKGHENSRTWEQKGRRRKGHKSKRTWEQKDMTTKGHENKKDMRTKGHDNKMHAWTDFTTISFFSADLFEVHYTILPPLCKLADINVPNLPTHPNPHCRQFIDSGPELLETRHTYRLWNSQSPGFGNVIHPAGVSGWNQRKLARITEYYVLERVRSDTVGDFHDG